MVNEISKIKIGDIVHSLKDSEARAAIETLQSAVSSSLVFKGVVSNATDIIELTDYKIGWTYKVNADFEFSPFGLVENGDMIVCISSYNSAYNSADWTIVQNNIDTMVGANSTQDGARGLVPAPTMNDYQNFLRGDGTWVHIETGISWGNMVDLS